MSRTTAPCACGSGAAYKKCCRPLHRGRPAPTPEALMRSRYTAYALDLPQYIISTTHPGGPHWEPDPGRWLESIRRFTDATDFQGLTVLSHAEDGDRGEVCFRVQVTQGGVDAGFGERSTFLRVDGRWLYHSGESI